MKYSMIHTSGSLQEGTQTKNNKQRHRLLANPNELGLTNRIKNALVQQDMAVSQKVKHITNRADRENLAQNKKPVNLEKKSMFFYTIAEGQQVLVMDKNGRGTIIPGPRRLWRWGKRIKPLQRYIAYPGEFLVIKYCDGKQEHLPGPKEEWLDPRIHIQIEKNDALQIAGKEAVVAYAKDETGKISRRVVSGPALFMPNPGEWLHTFSWHGSKDDNYKKVPGGLVFQKLWLMPDQMYHDVEEVRTADDIVLTIKLMIFFELVDTEKMLDGTHDPIGDFLNAASSDVIDMVARYSFEQFKANSDKLNDIESYSQLCSRADQVGYRLHKVVYRGYNTAKVLQQMHQQAIETRTRLKLEQETEEQTQKLADFKQARECERAVRRREQEKQDEIHQLEKQKLRHAQKMELYQQHCRIEHEERQQVQDQKIQYFQKLNQMQVDLTKYLTKERADRVIEVRGSQSNPHIHLDSQKRNEEE